MTGMNLNKFHLVPLVNIPILNKKMEVSFSNPIQFKMHKIHLHVKGLNKLLRVLMIIIKKKNLKRRSLKKSKLKKKKNCLLMRKDFVNVLIKDAIKNLKRKKIMIKHVIIRFPKKSLRIIIFLINF